jgi:hypothetical protein
VEKANTGMIVAEQNYYSDAIVWKTIECRVEAKKKKDHPIFTAELEDKKYQAEFFF